MEELETMVVIAEGEIIELINEVLQILSLHSSLPCWFLLKCLRSA